MLLQEIRCMQAMKERGIAGFPVIRHSENRLTTVGDKKYKLIFPEFIFNYQMTEKTINYLFVGKLDKKRQDF